MKAEGEPSFVEMTAWRPALHTVPAHVSIMLICKSCGMRRPILMEPLRKVAGDETSLDRIEKRLRCSFCHKKDGRIALGYYTTPV